MSAWWRTTSSRYIPEEANKGRVKKKLRIKFTDFWADMNEPEQNDFYQLLARHWDVEFSDQPDIVIPKPDPAFVKKQQEDEQQRLANQGPPPPPPIPLKFYGFATQAGQPKRVFLSSTSGDDVFMGTEGQVINKRYRIVKINNASVEMEDILNSNKQTLPLTSPQT